MRSLMATIYYDRAGLYDVIRFKGFRVLVSKTNFAFFVI